MLRVGITKRQEYIYENSVIYEILIWQANHWKRLIVSGTIKKESKQGFAAFKKIKNKI